MEGRQFLLGLLGRQEEVGYRGQLLQVLRQELPREHCRHPSRQQRLATCVITGLLVDGDCHAAFVPSACTTHCVGQLDSTATWAGTT